MSTGDKKKIAVLASFFSLFLAVGAGYAGEETDKIMEGKSIYHERCAACHGLDGVSLLPDVPEFAKGERLDSPDEELLESLRHGKGMMPAWGDVLSEKERERVLSYLKIIPGNKIFDEKCAGCHKKGIPAPKAGELDRSAGGMEICPACNIESRMSEQEMLDVLKYIRTLSK